MIDTPERDQWRADLRRLLQLIENELHYDRQRRNGTNKMRILQVGSLEVKHPYWAS